MIDANGYRANVAIVLLNPRGQVFWGRRIGLNGWQFPQGGILPEETPEQAMFRELREETGLEQHHVEVLACTRKWLRYRLPERYVRYHQHPVCIGQKQLWFSLALKADDAQVRVDHSDTPEFDSWCWVDYWEPIRRVVSFKRDVYARALSELARQLTADRSFSLPANPWRHSPRRKHGRYRR
jgi:putative (di)nucleoside polyphosphate hydrolase